MYIKWTKVNKFTQAVHLKSSRNINATHQRQLSQARPSHLTTLSFTFVVFEVNK